MRELKYNNSMELTLNDRKYLESKDFEKITELRTGNLSAIYTSERRGLPKVIKTIEINETPDSLQELTALIKVGSHNNICSIEDYFIHENRIFLILEYIKGVTLRDLILYMNTSIDSDFLGLAKCIIHEISSALNFAHERNVFHKDISLENIMITVDGAVKLIDFGISSTLNADYRTNFGRAKYLGDTDAQNLPLRDQYALGIVALETLKGRIYIDAWDKVIRHSINKDLQRINDNIENSLKMLLSNNYESLDEIAQMESDHIHRHVLSSYVEKCLLSTKPEADRARTEILTKNSISIAARGNSYGKYIAISLFAILTIALFVGTKYEILPIPVRSDSIDLYKENKKLALHPVKIIPYSFIKKEIESKDIPYISPVSLVSGSLLHGYVDQLTYKYCYDVIMSTLKKIKSNEYPTVNKIMLLTGKDLKDYTDTEIHIDVNAKEVCQATVNIKLKRINTLGLYHLR
ncbi:hypothetical protein A9Q84_00185 [Halobacteriovorax marinus]|uniref:mitogen-activated protein kinase kinase n=1 Tax=Halobacteriovorax marinus TaxID=97084 RepID=A0A1Y5FJT2_9BACT|nr:hypothetical protein A9Q84_00185 [Halobacteriovorax marinus]